MIDKVEKGLGFCSVSNDEKDILEALKMCCDPENDCHECPYRKMHAGCDVLDQDALHLIIKLQKENESLKAKLGEAKLRAAGLYHG